MRGARRNSGGHSARRCVSDSSLGPSSSTNLLLRLRRAAVACLTEAAREVQQFFHVTHGANLPPVAFHAGAAGINHRDRSGGLAEVFGEFEDIGAATARLGD